MKTCEVVVGGFAPKLEAIGLQWWVRHKANELRDTPSVIWPCCCWDLGWNFHLALHCTGWELWGEGGNVRGHWLRFLSLLLWDFDTMGGADLQLWRCQQWGAPGRGRGLRSQPGWCVGTVLPRKLSAQARTRLHPHAWQSSVVDMLRCRGCFLSIFSHQVSASGR